MPLNIPTFLTRTASAIVFAAIMLTGLLWNIILPGIHFPALALLLMLIQVLCMREYFRLMKLIWPEDMMPSWLPVITQLIGLAPYVRLLPLQPLIKQVALFIFIPASLCVPAVLMLLATLSKRQFWNNTMRSFGALCYIVLPLYLLSASQVSTSYTYFPIILVLLIWINDTMAYIVGSLIGKTPFTEISPKKTWEGTIGGILLTVITAAIWSYFSKIAHSPDSVPGWWGTKMPQYAYILYWTGFAFIVGVAGTVGDLLKSKLKRMAGVKDSGNLMPGHGGALDRFDSLLIATPFVFAYMIVFTFHF